MIEGPDTVEDELDEPTTYYQPDTDTISAGVGATAYVDRQTLHECIERFAESPITRFPETFDRFYFDTPNGAILVDVLQDGTPEQLAEERARKHVEFKAGWCAEHGRRYLALAESDISVDKIRRLIAGAPEPQVSQPASQHKPAQAKRGQIQRPKAAA